jgi:hypothetical protein
MRSKEVKECFSTSRNSSHGLFHLLEPYLGSHKHQKTKKIALVRETDNGVLGERFLRLRECFASDVSRMLPTVAGSTSNCLGVCFHKMLLGGSNQEACS